MNRRCRHLIFVLAAALISPVAAVAQDDQFADGLLEDVLGEFGYDSEPTPGEVEYFEPELIEQTAEGVFDSPEFRTLPRLDLGDGVQTEPVETETSTSSAPASSSGGGQIGGGFADFLRALFGSVGTALMVLLALLVVGGILAAIIFMVRGRREGDVPDTTSDDAVDDEEPAPLVSPGARPPDAWLAAARAAAAAGRFEEAVSLLLLGAMGHAERAGLIRPRRGLTYRDYLRVVPRASAWHAALDHLIRTYAPIGFGRRSASQRIFEEVVVPYEAALAAEPLANSAAEHSPLAPADGKTI